MAKLPIFLLLVAFSFVGNAFGDARIELPGFKILKIDDANQTVQYDKTVPKSMSQTFEDGSQIIADDTDTVALMGPLGSNISLTKKQKRIGWWFTLDGKFDSGSIKKDSLEIDSKSPEELSVWAKRQNNLSNAGAGIKATHLAFKNGKPFAWLNADKSVSYVAADERNNFEKWSNRKDVTEMRAEQTRRNNIGNIYSPAPEYVDGVKAQTIKRKNGNSTYTEYYITNNTKQVKINGVVYTANQLNRVDIQDNLHILNK